MSGSLAIDVTGTTEGFQAAMRQAASSTEKEMARIKRELSYATTYLRDLEKAQKAAGAAAADQAKVSASIERIVPQAKAASISVGQMNNALRQTPAQLTDIVTQLAGGQSPFLIMIQQGGQMRDMFGGFGNMFRGLASMITPAGAAIGAVGAAIGALVYGYVKGVEEQEKFNKALVLTGNYAGQTATSFKAMSEAIASSTPATIGAAKEVMQELIATGTVGPQLLSDFGQAVARMAALTGKSSQDVVADFVKMKDGVAKWVAEHNQSMHFVSASQFEYIRTLEQSGKAAEAEKVALDAINAQLRESDKTLHGVAAAWDSVKRSASSYLDYLSNLGKDTSVDDQIINLQKSLKVLKESQQEALRSSTLGPLTADAYKTEAARIGGQIASMEKLLAHLQDGKRTADKLAGDTAAAKDAQADGIAARNRVDALLEQRRGATALAIALKELEADFAKSAAAGAAFTDSQKKAAIEAKKRELTPASTIKLESEFESTSKALQNEAVRLEASASYWKKYAKQMDDSREAVMRFRVTQGDLKSLPTQQKNTLVSLAAHVDADKRAESLAKEDAEVEKRVAAMEAEASARQKSAREAFIEQRVHAALGESLNAEAKKRAEVAAAAEYDAQRADAFIKSMNEQSVSIDKEIASLESQAALIGATTLERQQAADAIKVQADAEKMLATFTGKEAEINQWAAQQVKKLTAARAEAYSKQREFTTGAKNAMAKYNEDAANQGRYAENLVSGSLNKMEDALVKFAKTGKLQFGDLFNYMADEFLRQQARMIVSQASGGSGGLMGLLTSAVGLFGGGSGAAAPANSSQYALTSGSGEMGLKLPGHANGLDYVPYDNYVARLHEGEKVLTKQQAKTQGGVALNINQVLHIGQGVNRAEVYAAVMQGKEATKAEILSSMNHNGIFGRRA